MGSCFSGFHYFQFKVSDEHGELSEPVCVQVDNHFEIILKDGGAD